MCLVVPENTRKRKTTTNRIVYKMVDVYSDGIIKSPYEFMTVDFNIPYVEENPITISFENGEGKVKIGFHSFKTKEKVFEYMEKELHPMDGAVLKVAKCLVPKGSVIVKGEFDGLVSYVTDKIMYLEFVDKIN